MTTKTVANFTVKYKQILQEDGVLVDELPKFILDAKGNLNSKELIALYKMMVQIRVFDAKAIALQRTGNLGTYPSTLGQEAIALAAGSAMSPDDVLCPYYREIGAQFWRGVKMEEVLTAWGGNEAGNNYQSAPSHDFPICIPIASQSLHAVGAASAFKYRGEKRAAVTIVGDGATSRGDFYESLNVAGVWRLPVVFLVNNNQWAISVPLSQQTKTKTIAQKGIAAGVKSIQVDGNDILALREAMEEALDFAYTVQRPTLIEAITYRMGDHTTADDARRYRTAEELELNKQKDPITRVRKYLENNNLWSDDKENTLIDDITIDVQQAVDKYMNVDAGDATEMFNHLYETLPEAYEWQRQEVGEN